MSQIKRQRREHLLAVRANPSLTAPSTWKGPAHPAPSALSVEEAAARALRPRSLGHRLVQLWRWADLHAPHLVDPAHRHGMTRLAHLAWLRPLDAVGAVADVRELVSQLLCRYPIPRCLVRVFDADGGDRRLDPDLARFAAVAATLGRGGGYREVAALLHGELTRRVFANLVTSVREEPMVALRAAQVAALGGPEWLAEPLVRHRSFARLGGGSQRLLTWLCREAEPAELGHVLDYLLAVPTELEGRTWASVLRLVEAWRRPRSPAALDTRPFAASGIGTVLPPAYAEWRLRELRSSLELFVDGNVMRHCVATYTDWVRAGSTSIWSARRGDRRCLTIEVRNGPREIVQVRGVCNRLPDVEEIGMLHAWAAANGLVLVPAAVK